MTKKRTTSDLMKEFCAQAAGGKPADWKRRSKKKNDTGNFVRAFENIKTGQMIHIEELPGKQIKPYNPDDENTQSKSSQASAMTADEFMEKLVNDDLYDNSIDINATVKALGKDLATKFVFAYYGEDEMMPGFPVWMIAPKDDDYAEELCDQEIPLGALLPDGADDGNGCGNWHWVESDMTPVERAIDLIKRGFSWSESYQGIVDNEYDEENIEKVIAAMKALQQTPTKKPGSDPSP